MEVDVAVLGGGPGGYTAAIRAAQLGAKVLYERYGFRPVEEKDGTVTMKADLG